MGRSPTPWIESHTSLARDPKVTNLMAALDVDKPTAIGHLHLLWWWALDFAHDGDLSKFSAAQVALAAEWRGHPETFSDGLRVAGFMEQDGKLHDWWEYAGRLIDQRERNAKRMRDARAAHVQRTFSARAGATVPDLTVPDLTEEQAAPSSTTPPLHPGIGKYLGKLASLSPIFADVTPESVAEMGAERGFSELALVGELEAAATWWPTAPRSKLPKKSGRMFLINWLNNSRKWADERQAEAPPEKPRCECDGGYTGHFSWCPVATPENTIR